LKFKLFHPKNEFLAIDCSDSNIRALAFRYSDGALTFKKFFSGTPKEDAGRFLTELKPHPDTKVLFLYDNSTAATFGGFVRLTKSDSSEPLTGEDFENFLFHAVKQFSNRFREEAKRKLGTDDVNIVLANNRFLNLRLDGRQVVNPVGIRAKFAELQMEQTFLVRNFLNVLHDSLSEVKQLFHIESTGALSDLAGRYELEKKVLLAEVLESRTRFMGLGGKQRYFGAVSFPKMQERGESAFGFGAVLGAVSSRFGVDREVARAMLARYAAGDMSRQFSFAFRRAIQPAVSVFWGETGKFMKKDDFMVIAADVPFLRPAGEGITPLPYRVFSFDGLAKDINIAVSAPRFFPREAFSPVFLSALVAYLNRTGDNYLNTLAREKVSWLLPQNSA